LIVFSFLAFRNTVVYAWPDFHIEWPAISFPSSTPTPTIGIFHFDPGVFELITTSAPTPTNTPTLTPTPTTEEPTVEPTKETVEEEITTAVSPTSTTAATTNVSPTQKPKKTVVLSPKNLIYGGVVGLLVLIVLVQAWPAIKKFLHDKTA